MKIAAVDVTGHRFSDAAFSPHLQTRWANRDGHFSLLVAHTDELSKDMHDLVSEQLLKPAILIDIEHANRRGGSNLSILGATRNEAYGPGKAMSDLRASNRKLVDRI